MTKLVIKRPLAIFTTSLMLSIIFSSAVQAKRGPHGGDRDRGRSAEQVFEHLDSSGDGLLTLDEFTASLEERVANRFNRKDSDEDGFLSLEEATSNRRGEAPDHSDIAAEIVACVTTLAEDDDSITVPDESRFDSPQDRFNAADTSEDGFISLEEAQNNALSKAPESFTDMDSDSSGDINLDEFEAHQQSRKATRQAIRSCIAELEEDAVV
ncbi:EF-hand domain-containing protein [Planctobacterium marinum]|uniref:EF-hand domain-containing protein n=1 Tax=Planctobacterium marinum TaxID=1631968 RepID=UPI001E4D6EC7|nr:hypothetical protein [Planctobacterium marinum]MCC2605473.1 hypothetical protein [Planctobacterium marinum]